MHKRIFHRGFLEVFYLCRCKLVTFFTVKNARILRLPIDIRGKKGIDFGYGLTTGYGCRFESFSEDGSKSLFFGNNVLIRYTKKIIFFAKIKITATEHRWKASNRRGAAASRGVSASIRSSNDTIAISFRINLILL